MNFPFSPYLDIVKYIPSRRKVQLLLLLLLTIVTATLEVVSIGAVLPFLSVLIQPEEALSYPTIVSINKFLKIQSSDELLFILTVGFIITVIIANFMRVLLIWASMRISNAIGSDLSYRIFQFMINRPYSEHANTNSSEFINAVINKVNSVILQVVNPILDIVSSLVILLAILSLLLFIDPNITVITIIILVFIYLLIGILTRKKLLINSEIIAFNTTKIVQVMQESMGSVKDIILGSMQEEYSLRFRKLDWRFRYTQGINVVINQSPRYIVEAIGVIIIVVISYKLVSTSNNPSDVIPTLGILILGAQRILPLMQKTYRSWSMVKGGQASFIDVLFFVKQEINIPVSREHIDGFNNFKKIDLKDLSFCYAGSQNPVIENISLSFNKGNCIGIVGKSGCGKTTLLDLIMGLLTPSDGSILIDDKILNNNNILAWQKHISHVPQDVFLIDGSIEENVALGVSKEHFDIEKIKNCLDRVQLTDLIDSLPHKAQTYVGEKGALLSGGQRQRIAIARSLYRDTDVFIFDEATSALDEKTEKEVISILKNISSENLVIMVTHRLSILESCDQVIDLEKLLSN